VKNIKRSSASAIVLFLAVLILLDSSPVGVQSTRPIAFKGALLIDGTGRQPVQNAVLIIDGDKIRAVGPSGSISIPKDADVRDVGGKTIMPALVNIHGHPGVTVNGLDTATEYTQENARKQLERYLAYGVGTVGSFGQDEDLVYKVRDDQHAGSLGGARLFTAGRGFLGGGRPVPGDVRYRPQSADEARADVRELAAHHPDFMKMWMSANFQPAVYQAISDEGHRNQLRLFAHMYYLAEAKALLAAGIDGFAHSVRDVPVDDELIRGMKARGVFLIPTLAREEVVYIWAEPSKWLNDPFFVNGLEPGILTTLQSPAFQEKFRKDPDLAKYKAGLAMAQRNLKTLYDAGVTIGFGTDSGLATRFTGYMEHRELQLMVEAGLTPMQAIVIATSGSAKILRGERVFGTLQPGMQADFLVLDASPLDDIRNTEKLSAVWQAGKTVRSVSATQAAASPTQAATSAKQPTDPQAGTWKMNLEKSTFVAGGPHPTGETVVNEAVEGGLKVVSSGGFQYTAKYDGKDYPMTGSSAADGVVLRRIDANTIETIRKKNGTVVTSNITFISTDGKTRSNVFQGKNAKGEPITWLAVFDKQ
jgi:imidazolonepropionase-like amidohydrolase